MTSNQQDIIHRAIDKALERPRIKELASYFNIQVCTFGFQVFVLIYTLLLSVFLHVYRRIMKSMKL